MPPRPTARCCRAAKHLRAPLDNIWITDSVLASAFERYCHVSRLSRRNSSSVPGPLENRKRLGKRRITGLYSADFQPTLPPWLIEFPADLTQWKWLPPTEPSLRMKAEESPQQKSWSLLAWMDQLLPAEEAVDYPGTDQDAALQPSDDFSDRLQEARAALDKSSGRLHPDFHLAMDRLRHDLYLGLLTPDTIPEALTSFSTTILEATQERQITRSATTAFLSAAVNGLAFSRVQGLAQADAQLCDNLLQRISELHASKSSAELLRTLLTVAPDEHIGQLGQGLRAVLQTWLAAPPRVYEAAGQTIAEALARLSPAEHISLLHGMEHVAMNGDVQTVAGHSRRLRWLAMLARMPQVDTTYLIEACSRSACFSQAPSPAAERELSRIFLQQWQSRGYLRHSRRVESAWKREAGTNPELSLGSLAWNVGTLEWSGDGGSNRVGLLMSLFRALRRLDMFDGFLASFARYCRSRPDHLGEAGFRAVALAGRDHTTAVAVYELMKHHRGRSAAGRLWTWNDWHPYIRHMILDPSVDPNLVWEVLHLRSPAERGGSSRSVELRRRTKQNLVANMAMWFSQAAHLSDRASLRHVSRCNAWLQAQGLPPAASGVEAVMKAAVRDLKRGEPGRTARLNWALDLTERRLGAEQAEKTGKVLEMWRRRNSMLGRT